MDHLGTSKMMCLKTQVSQKHTWLYNVMSLKQLVILETLLFSYFQMLFSLLEFKVNPRIFSYFINALLSKKGWETWGYIITVAVNAIELNIVFHGAVW